MAAMTAIEHRKLIHVYLGVTQGYLGGFGDIGELERFYAQCGVDVNPREYQGTNRAKFEEILSKASPADQALIIRSALDKCPPDCSVWDSRTQRVHDELMEVAKRLEGASPVGSVTPAITSAVVERAIADTETLITTQGATSGVDRIHTTLHGYLKAVCDDVGIIYTRETTMNGLFRMIREQHPAFTDLGPRAQDVTMVVRAMASIMDAMNPIRNMASVAHPNEELLDTPEAILVINAARTILHYLNAKISSCPIS